MPCHLHDELLEITSASWKNKVYSQLVLRSLLYNMATKDVQFQHCKPRGSSVKCDVFWNDIHEMTVQ